MPMRRPRPPGRSWRDEGLTSRPTRVLGSLLSMRLTSVDGAGDLRCCAVPIVRRMPAWVRRISDALVGEGRLAALCACDNMTRRLSFADYRCGMSRSCRAAFEPECRL